MHIQCPRDYAAKGNHGIASSNLKNSCQPAKINHLKKYVAKPQKFRTFAAPNVEYFI